MANEVKLKLAIEGGKVVIDEIDGVSTRINKLDGNARAAASGAGNLGTALGSLATLGTALAIIKMADSATTLHTALKLSTNSAYEATIAYSALYDIAQQSRVSFTELGQTYATISRAGKELGVSQDRLLTVTQAIGNAMTIGGGSAASMQAALVQLGQGLGSGVLRGEELNSILEQTPRLAKALADGMGVPIGQLRSLGEQGKLTSEMVISALEKSAPQLAKELSGATVTVGQAFTMLTNSATKFVGDADSASGASGNLANALQSASKAVDTVGSAIENNKDSFGVIINSLAGAATVAGLGAVANGIRLVWAAVMAGGAANPVILGLMVLGGIGGAALALGKQFSESETIIKASVAGMKNEIAAIDRQTQDSSANLTESEKINNAVRRASLESDVKTYSQKLALMAGENKDNDTFSKLESARLAAGLSDQRITGAIALDEARKLGKLRTDIEQKSTEDATKIVMSFRQKIQDNPADLASLSTEMAQRLKANVTETLADLKSFDEKLAAPGKEAAKQRLTDTIANYEIYQGIVSTGEKAALATIKAQKDAGYLSDQAYADKERDIAANAATDMQALTELQLDATRKSGLSKKDRAEAERKYVQELSTLGELQVAITEKNSNATLVIEAKLQNEKRAYRKAETDSIEKYFADQAALHHAELKTVDDKITSAKDETAAILMAAASNITLAEAIDQVALARMLERQASFVPGSAGWDAEQAKIDKARELIGVLKDKTVAQNWVDTSKTIQGSLTDAFVASVDSGKNLFMSLRDSVVGMFKTLVLRPMIQTTVGSAMGVGTAAQGLGAVGGVGNALGGLSTMNGIYNAATVGYGSMMGSAATALLGQTAGNAAIATAVTGSSSAAAAAAAAAAEAGGAASATAASAASMGATFATAVPYIAAALVAYKIFGGSGFVSSEGTGRAKIDYNAAGVGTANLLNDGSQAQIDQRILETNALATSYYKTAQALNIKAIATTFDVNGNTGRQGENPNTGISVTAGKASYSSGEVAASDQVGLANAMSRALLTALQASTLPKELAGVFDGMVASTMTAAQITVVLNGVTALENFHKALQNLPFDSLKDLSFVATQNLINVSGGLDTLGANLGSFYSSFYTDAQRAVDSEKSLSKAFEELGVQMPAIGKDTDAWYKSLVLNQMALDQNDTATARTTAGILALASGLRTTADEAKKAVQALATTVTNLSSTQRGANTALAAVGSNVQAIQDRLQSSKDAIKQAYDGASANLTAAQDRVTSLNEQAAQAMRAFASSIGDFLDSIKASGGSQSLTALKAQFSSSAVLAQGGDAKAQGNLVNQAKLVLEKAKSSSSSSSDYLRSEAFVRTTLLGVQDAVVKAAGPEPMAEMVIAQREVITANNTLVAYAELAKLAGVTQTTVLQDSDKTLNDLLDAYNSAKSDSLSALTLTQGLAIRNTGTLDALLGSLEDLGVANDAVTQAQTAAGISVTDTSSKLVITAESANSLATALGLTGTAASGFVTLLTGQNTAIGTLATALGLPNTNAAALATQLGLTGTAASTFVTQVGSSSAAFLAMFGSTGTIGSEVSGVKTLLGAAGLDISNLIGLIKTTKLDPATIISSLFTDVNAGIKLSASGMFVDPTGRVLASAAGLFTDTTGRVLTNASGMFVDPTGKVISSAAGLFTDTEGRILTNAMGLFTDPTGKVVASALGMFIDPTGKVISTASGLFTDSDGKILKNAAGMFTDPAGNVLTTATGMFADPTHSVLSSAAGLFVDPTHHIVTSATELFKDSDGAILRNAAGLFVDPAGRILTNALGMFVDPTGKLLSTATGLFADPQGKVLTNALGLFVDTDGRVLTKASGLFVDANGKVLDSAAGVFTDTSGHVMTKAMGLFTDADGKVLTNAAGMFVDPTGKVLSTASGMFGDASGTVLGSASQLFNDPTKSVLSTAVGVFTGVNGAIKTSAESVFSGVATTISNKLKEILAPTVNAPAPTVITATTIAEAIAAAEATRLADEAAKQTTAAIEKASKVDPLQKQGVELAKYVQSGVSIFSGAMAEFNAKAATLGVSVATSGTTDKGGYSQSNITGFSGANRGALIDYLDNTYYKDYGVTMRQALDDVSLNAYNEASPKLTALREQIKTLGGVPAFAVGTNYVPHDMLAKIHEGEAIVPKAYNPAANRQSSNQSSQDNAELLAEMRALKQAVQALQKAADSSAASGKKTSDILTRVTRDGESMAVKQQ